MSECNGFTNWETWNLRNWILNTENHLVIPADADTTAWADDLREQHLDRVDDMPHGFERDALTQTYEAVNWPELVESLKEEPEE